MRRSGREMKVETIANAFKVSTRSMQKHLKELEQENVIRREAVYDENGRRKSNRIVYIGDKPRFTGNEKQIEKVCTEDNPLKLRDFRWEGYPEIKEYIFNKYNDKVSTLNIAQTKAKYGIIERERYNKLKDENYRRPKCAREKIYSSQSGNIEKNISTDD